MVFDVWVADPGHLEHMLAKYAKQIGIGTAQVPVGVGAYKGQSNPYTVTATFGPPQPALRLLLLVTWIRGIVLIREPGEKTLRQLTGSELVPSGTETETSTGRVRVTSAADDEGHVQTADFYEGRFVAAYADNFPTLIPPPIVTTVTLSGSLSGCAARKTARHLARCRSRNRNPGRSVTSGAPARVFPQQRQVRRGHSYRNDLADRRLAS